MICAKGSAGIMKQVSPARLTQPLLRKPGSERGAGDFEPLSWDHAFELLTERPRKIRATGAADPPVVVLRFCENRSYAAVKEVALPNRCG